MQKGFTVELPACFYQNLLKEKGKVWSTILRREDTEGREKTLKAGRVEGGEPNEGRRGRS